MGQGGGVAATRPLEQLLRWQAALLSTPRKLYLKAHRWSEVVKMRLVCIWVGLLLTGCADVTITPSRMPKPELPVPQFTAVTSWYSNDTSVPKRRMLRAAAKQCGLEEQAPESVLPFRGPYGVHGTWFLDFACP